MTVSRVKDEMDLAEYLDWIAFDNWRNEERERGKKKGKSPKNMMSSPEAMLEGFGIGNKTSEKG